VRTEDSPAPEEARLPVSGEAFTRSAVTVVTATIVALTFAFSLGNVTRLCMDLDITGWIAWLVGPAVDLSVVGLLTGMRFLSLHGYTDDELRKPRNLLRLCGFLTLALNTAGALGHQQFGTALVDAVGPVLLIGWSEVGPWMLRQVFAVCSAAAPPPKHVRPAPEVPQVLPVGLLAQARKLDADHRTATGRPISRDALRAQLRIGRDRASAVRAEAPVPEAGSLQPAA
jgi:hypothetical protein